MRRIPAALLLCLGIVLAGAAPSRPTPAPKPSASPTPAAAPEQVTSLPIIVVFPFGTSTDIAAANGAKAATLFVQVMNSAGGIDAIGAPTTIKRDNYLSYARTVNADYYVTGYMTPLGEGVSLVEQVVSTRSGTMIFGQTAQINSFADASSQAIAVHDSLIAQEQAFKAQYQSAQATSTPAPAAGGQANLTKGFSDIAGLFKRKGKAATKTVAVQKPGKGILVAHVNGSVPQTNLTSATSALYAALNGYYNTRLTNAPGDNLVRQADSICGSDRNNTIATGTLSAKTTRHGLGSRTEWTFDLNVYTCWGAKLATQSATAGSLKDAVAGAVSAYAQAHPQNS